jgi:hypothetical protein
MSTVFPRSSQLKYQHVTKDIDYVNRLPVPDKMRLNEYYQKGIYPANYYPDFDINAQNEIQIIANQDPRDLNVYLRDAVTNKAVKTFEFEDVTPSGWVNDSIFVAKTNFENTGVFYYRFFVEGIGYVESDTFYVKDWSKTKDLVKLTYYDTFNRNGGVYFANETTQIWAPSVYYTGYLIEDAPTFDIDEFVDEPNNSFNTKSTPKLNATLTLTNFHVKYLSNLAHQLSCDHLYINNDERYNLSDLSYELIDNTEIANVTINLSRNDNNNYQQTF